MNMSFATVDRDGREIIDAQEFIKGIFQFFKTPVSINIFPGYNHISDLTSPIR